ncbi:AraC family transcriptional regulator [Amycolatopsis sp. 195334CR]|uniref:AraC family transcriptional regulator n=1 Tax=Amycolatopsis sp. 195334CR TaxID=2814588 RepID=UPI001A8E302C|nr:AraC family transcriptional regulator [Amycolatopsis sp. 195334CR]MBN6040118.1 AraC family transcriptional regulator [Amycolatopsis sp. 195334CR]
MRTGDIPPPADPLGEALHFLRMSGAFYCRSEMSGPWHVAIPSVRDCVWFHVVTAGSCTLEVDGAEPRELRPGDLALVPHGRGHALWTDRELPAAAIEKLPHDYVSDRYAILHHGGGGTPSGIICGAVRFDHPAAAKLLELLPRLIYVAAADSPQAEWLQSSLRLMIAEAAQPRPGGETVITRLSDILVIQAIRSWMETDPVARTGWLGALQDRQIGRAISLIHRDAAREWTVASLADELAMSRSAFAARFTELVGEPAMHYVTRWRMNVALTTLREDGATVAELAGKLGYQSEAAFSRAFKRVVGVSPGSVRTRGTSRTEADLLAF